MQFIFPICNPTLKQKKFLLFKGIGAERDVVGLYEAIQQISN